jgi:hypothetical protein
MRSFTLLFSLFLALACALPASAEETVGPTLSEGVQAKAKPLLKALSLLGTPTNSVATIRRRASTAAVSSSMSTRKRQKSACRAARAEMSKQGETVAQSDLKPGDLVFFNTRKKPNSHVGIYAGDGTFVHASSSHGKEVMVSRINEKYWANRFNGARRILPLE